MIHKLGKLVVSNILALLVAFIILSFFSLFYYNMPLIISNHDNVTNNKKEENYFYSSIAKEGIVWGKTNNEGYNNLFDYNENTPVDILIMGSSHMEAMQVMQDESTAAILNNLYGGG